MNEHVSMPTKRTISFNVSRAKGITSPSVEPKDVLKATKEGGCRG